MSGKLIKSGLAALDGSIVRAFHGTTQAAGQKLSPELANAASHTGVPLGSLFFSDNPAVANSYAQGLLRLRDPALEEVRARAFQKMDRLRSARDKDKYKKALEEAEAANKAAEDSLRYEFTSPSGAMIYPVNLDTRGFSVIDVGGRRWNDLGGETINTLAASAKESGAPGLAVSNVVDLGPGAVPGRVPPSTTYAVFDPDRVSYLDQFGASPEILAILRKYGLIPPLLAPTAAPYLEEGE